MNLESRHHILAPLAAGLVTLAAATPWLLGFAGHAAVANGIAFAMAFAPLALMIAALPAAAIACVAGGVWLAASPVADADATHYTVS